MYGLATLDSRGRVADRVVVRALGWRPGTCLDVAVVDGLVVVSARLSGGSCVSAAGYVRLPARVRRAVGLGAADRVVLVAEPGSGRLVVYPPVVLDEVLAGYQAGVLGGGRP